MNDYNIKKLYEDMEIELIASMKRNYKRHLKEEDKTGFKYSQWQAEKLKELKRYQRENKNIISGYTKGLPKEISKHLNNELKEGSIKAINQYNKVMGKRVKSLKPNKIMNHSFFRTNGRKVNALIKAVNNDLKTANTAVLRMANDQYRQVIHKSAFFVTNGVFTEKQAANMATKELTELQKTKFAIDEANKDFLSRGFNCIEYKDGRRVNIASYSQMAVRTASLRAQLMGEGDFRKSIGRVLVKSTSHGGACPICQKWENKIFIDDVYSGGTKKDGKYMLLSDAMKQGFLHPNCRHGLTTYYPELDDLNNYTDEEYEDDVNWINNRINELTNGELNYVDRNIKRFDRLEKGSISSVNIQRFAQKKHNWVKEKTKLKNENIKSIIPSYQMDNNRRYMTDNEIKDLANKMNKTLSKYTNKKSKWSKNISIVNNENAGKLWSCDIRISNNTLEQEILHELLHARSISYYDEDVFIKYMYEEESVVEMFNKQILLKEKIPYYDNAYSNMVECLEEISDIIGEDKYEFAKKLFNVKVSEREKWLRNLFKNNSNKEKLEDLLREAFVKW